MKTHIVLHHSLTKDGQTVSWKAIERYHRDVNRFKDIGYHYGVEQIGTEFYVLVGRDELDSAAAVKGQSNTDGIHICCVGNYDLAEPPLGMIEALVHRIIVPLMRRHKIKAENIVGHNHYNINKTCPGHKFDVARIQDISRDVYAKLHTPSV